MYITYNSFVISQIILLSCLPILEGNSLARPRGMRHTFIALWSKGRGFLGGTRTSIGVTLQSDGKFNEHVRTKLVKANKCLHVLRTLRKEHYPQAEIDHLFISIVLPNFNYALAVYGASESDLTVVQNFLDRCYKRRFISFPVSIKNLLIKQDRNILKKLRSTDCHPLKHIIPVQKTYVHNLRKKGCARPKINTERFMNTFVNRLIFKLHLL